MSQSAWPAIALCIVGAPLALSAQATFIFDERQPPLAATDITRSPAVVRIGDIGTLGVVIEPPISSHATCEPLYAITDSPYISIEDTRCATRDGGALYIEIDFRAYGIGTIDIPELRVGEIRLLGLSTDITPLTVAGDDRPADVYGRLLSLPARLFVALCIAAALYLFVDGSGILRRRKASSHGTRHASIGRHPPTPKDMHAMYRAFRRDDSHLSLKKRYRQLGKLARRYLSFRSGYDSAALTADEVASRPPLALNNVDDDERQVVVAILRHAEQVLYAHRLLSSAEQKEDIMHIARLYNGVEI